MTREEQTIQAAKDFLPHITNAQLTLFAAGAMWSDEHPKNPQLSAADRGIIDEIIFALNSLGKEKMISYHKEIEFLNKIRRL